MVLTLFDKFMVYSMIKLILKKLCMVENIGYTDYEAEIINQEKFVCMQCKMLAMIRYVML